MALSTKQSFLAGIGAALAVFFVVGFFVLLIMVLRTEEAPAPQAANPSAVAGNAAPEAPAINFAPVTDSDWMRGNPEAGVTIVEYSDLECPYCKSFHPEISQAVDEYKDRVRWVYRHFPLTSIHPKAPKEAEAAECAGELGGNDGFWAFIDRVFEVTPSNNGLDVDELPDIAEYAGIDRADFTACLESGRWAEKVQQQANDAVVAGGQGTPYSVIVTPDGEKIPVNGSVSYAQLKSFFDSVLN
ncbi:MAG: thioredoxin domain-containing protein [Parcubacteria group bacterium]|nr:thioredoxin domain-containing protein [Parcubacteria group bacterium]